MSSASPTLPERHVELVRNGRNQAVRIPREFERPGRDPWALESITGTLLEAIDRGLWDADPETEDRLRDINLSVEGDLEAGAATPGEAVSDD